MCRQCRADIDRIRAAAERSVINNDNRGARRDSGCNAAIPEVDEGEDVLATVQGRRSLLHVSTWSGAIDSIPPFDRAAAARLVSVSARGRWVLVSTRSGLVGAPTARPG